MCMKSRGVRGMSCLAALAVSALCGAAKPASAQDSLRTGERARIVRELTRAHELLPAAEVLPVAERAPIAERAVVVAPSTLDGTRILLGRHATQDQNVPQDVRIMQTIVTTALSQVEAPAPPKAPSDDSAGQSEERLLFVTPERRSLLGRGDVSGFYMQGYGYLFTVRWPVGSLSRFFGVQTAAMADFTGAVALQRAAVEDAAGQLEQLKQEQERAQADSRSEQERAQVEAKQEQERAQAEAQREQARAQAESQRVQKRARQALDRQRRVRTETRYRAQAKATAAWAAEYRRRLTDALRDAIAGYGSTLRRAKPGEAITFIADFGGGDSARVTMTVKAGALRGSDLDANRGLVHVSTGQSGVSERMHTQLEIMSQIIDTSLRSDDAGPAMYGGGWSVYLGGQADPQYVPGYGVIFRKNARMNTARTFVALPTTGRATSVDSIESAARKKYQAHLDTLRHETVEILSTYGPTLTALEDGDWVGIYYDVGSAAALLDGGMENYLVQARMRDIRQSSTQSDPAAWLEQRLVTNERED